MPLNLRELREWPPEIADLAGSTREVATNHTNSADFYRSLAKASTWEGDGGDAARAAMVASAGEHDAVAENLGKAAAGMEHAQQQAEAVAQKIKAILDYAAAPSDVLSGNRSRSRRAGRPSNAVLPDSAPCTLSPANCVPANTTVPRDCRVAPKTSATEARHPTQGHVFADRLPQLLCAPLPMLGAPAIGAPRVGGAIRPARTP